MASLGELYPNCVVDWFDLDGELLPSVLYECVYRTIVKEGERVIETKDELRAIGNVTHYGEQDSGHVLIKVKGKGWFALAEGKPGLKVLARSMV
jgi:hypothetical protein